MKSTVTVKKNTDKFLFSYVLESISTLSPTYSSIFKMSKLKRINHYKYTAVIRYETYHECIRIHKFVIRNFF